MTEKIQLNEFQTALVKYVSIFDYEIIIRQTKFYIITVMSIHVHLGGQSMNIYNEISMEPCQIETYEYANINTKAVGRQTTTPFSC